MLATYEEKRHYKQGQIDHRQKILYKKQAFRSVGVIKIDVCTPQIETPQRPLKFEDAKCKKHWP